MNDEDRKNLLIALGEPYRAAVLYCFGIMMRLVINHHAGLLPEHAKALGACDNSSTFEALKTVWMRTGAQNRLGHVVDVTATVKEIHQAATSDLRSDGVKEMVGEIASFLGCSDSEREMYETLITDPKTFRNVKAMRESLLDNFGSLALVGFVKVHHAERGPSKSKIIQGVSLTDMGNDFMTAVLRAAIRRTLRHPAARFAFEGDGL